jgi:hypothetical protein
MVDGVGEKGDKLEPKCLPVQRRSQVDIAGYKGIFQRSCKWGREGKGYVRSEQTGEASSNQSRGLCLSLSVGNTSRASPEAGKGELPQ